VCRANGEIIFDPDEQAQAMIRLVFDLHDQHRTIGKVLRHLDANDIELPIRVNCSFTMVLQVSVGVRTLT
jgi:hypothetical protein